MAHGMHREVNRDDDVKADPWRAIGILAGAAAIAGLITGLIVARR